MLELRYAERRGEKLQAEWNSREKQTEWLDGWRVNQFGQNQAAFLDRGTAGLGTGQLFGVGHWRAVCRPERHSANVRFLPHPADSQHASVRPQTPCGAPPAESKEDLEIGAGFGV